MSQLKRYNGTSWENVGGSVIPALDSTVSTTSTNGVENQAITNYVQNAISDTGWVPLTLTSSFSIYGNDTNNTPRYRRIGKMVEVKGEITPASQISANQNTTISTIPVGFRPSKGNETIVCQGSGMNRWTMQIQMDGTMVCQRYGISSNIAIPTGTWLPFSITYFVD